MITYVHTETYILMFTAVLFILAKRWKQPKCPSTDEGVNNLLCIHTMEYYSIITKNEVLTYATTLINLKRHYTKVAKHKGLYIA